MTHQRSVRVLLVLTIGAASGSVLFVPGATGASVPACDPEGAAPQPVSGMAALAAPARPTVDYVQGIVADFPESRPAVLGSERWIFTLPDGSTVTHVPRQDADEEGGQVGSRWLPAVAGHYSVTVTRQYIGCSYQGSTQNVTDTTAPLAFEVSPANEPTRINVSMSIRRGRRGISYQSAFRVGVACPKFAAAERITTTVYYERSTGVTPTHRSRHVTGVGLTGCNEDHPRAREIRHGGGGKTWEVDAGFGGGLAISTPGPGVRSTRVLVEIRVGSRLLGATRAILKVVSPKITALHDPAPCEGGCTGWRAHYSSG